MRRDGDRILDACAAPGGKTTHLLQLADCRVLAIDRGGLGFIVANGGAAASEQTLTTSLPPGEYCDVVTGGVADGACVGAAVTVAEDGTVSLTIPPDSAVALHVGATAG